jgi:hypothetical protein
MRTTKPVFGRAVSPAHEPDDDRANDDCSDEPLADRRVEEAQTFSIHPVTQSIEVMLLQPCSRRQCGRSPESSPFALWARASASSRAASDSTSGPSTVILASTRAGS